MSIPRVLPVFLLIPVVLFQAAAPASADLDGGWPRKIKAPEATILIYQPQPEAQEGNILTGRAAISITPKGKTEPVFGTLWYRTRVDVDRETRTVDFADVKITKSKFPGSTPELEEKLASIIEKEVPRWQLSESLDRLVASLQASEKEKAYAEGFNTTPPKILFEKVPAVLVTIDGKPVLRAVEGSEGLQRIINTPYFLVSDGRSYYLSGGTAWFTATDLQGEWGVTKNPPKEVAALYQKTQEQATQGTKGAEKKESPASGKQGEAKPPKILVATVPTELLVTDGEPAMAPITGTDLLYVSNTKSDIFLTVATQEYYLLLSGRWFKSKALGGPWEFLKPDALPADFKKIPEPSPKGEVLSSVAGTPQAEEALMDAQVPQTAAVKRSEAKTTVVYDGDPKFEKIPDTEVERAVNTASQVLRIKGKYWVCDQAVWFTGDSAKGPWTMADKAPPEVQKIPPESPAYNTKYVYVYDSTPEVVYVGYTPAYVGCYPYYGTVVWGTGWYYPPYVSPYVYYPHPVTFGFSAHYNPYTGWSMGFGVSYGPFTFSIYGGGHYGGYWGPAYAHGGYYHGGNTVIINNPGGGTNRPGGGVNNPGARPTPYGTNSNIYNKPENRGATASTMDKTSRPQAKPATGTANNVYSDRDGNVYQRSNDGSWQSREGNSWKSAGGGSDKARPSTGGGSAASGGGSATARPSTGTGSAPSAGASTYPSGGSRGSTQSTLDRDYSSRQRGNQRTQSYQGSGGGGGGRGGGGRGGRR